MSFVAHHCYRLLFLLLTPFWIFTNRNINNMCSPGFLRRSWTNSSPRAASETPPPRLYIPPWRAVNLTWLCIIFFVPPSHQFVAAVGNILIKVGLFLMSHGAIAGSCWPERKVIQRAGLFLSTRRHSGVSGSLTGVLVVIVVTMMLIYRLASSGNFYRN